MELSSDFRRKSFNIRKSALARGGDRREIGQPPEILAGAENLAEKNVAPAKKIYPAALGLGQGELQRRRQRVRRRNRLASRTEMRLGDTAIAIADPLSISYLVIQSHLVIERSVHARV